PQRVRPCRARLRKPWQVPRLVPLLMSCSLILSIVPPAFVGRWGARDAHLSDETFVGGGYCQAPTSGGGTRTEGRQTIANRTGIACVHRGCEVNTSVA